MWQYEVFQRQHISGEIDFIPLEKKKNPAGFVYFVFFLCLPSRTNANSNPLERKKDDTQSGRQCAEERHTLVPGDHTSAAFHTAAAMRPSSILMYVKTSPGSEARASLQQGDKVQIGLRFACMKLADYWDWRGRGKEMDHEYNFRNTVIQMQTIWI